ncbi:MAG: hypothetical protein H7Z42_08330 [Roseiflexaceae bacterium]|nr:hypothetical protein [Roseiflexaceae bacterium]
MSLTLVLVLGGLLAPGNNRNEHTALAAAHANAATTTATSPTSPALANPSAIIQANGSTYLPLVRRGASTAVPSPTTTATPTTPTTTPLPGDPAGTVVTYAGNAGNERLYAVLELSDKTVVAAGVADNLDWLSNTVPQTQLAGATALANAGGTNKIGFLLHLSADLSQVLRVLLLPQGAAEDIRFIKTTSAPGTPTGDLYISGTTTSGYFVARLDNNFVSAAPTTLRWVYNVAAAGDHKIRQPWDVGGDGKVVYGMGTPYDTEWAAIYRLNADGQQEVVENWSAHWSATAEWDGTPATSYPNKATAPLVYSGLVMKAGRKGSLRSASQADYNLLQSDGNGGTGRKGRFPDDYYFAGPCPLNAANCPGGPGYTGYRTSGRPTQRIGGITIDRRTNHMYIGYSTQSVLPDGNPDFEPAVVAMDQTGLLKWWSRLYTEQAANSTPDQYVDGLTLDYAQPPEQAALVVLARAHGNNTYNLWPAKSITKATNPDHPGYAFQNGWTGNNGNIHVAWLGKLRAGNGTLLYSTYVGEYADDEPGTQAKYTEPNLDGWPSFNAGWPKINTTRLETTVHVDVQGRVYITGVGRRTVTTANAYQKMLKPGQGASTWNDFVRVYTPDLTSLAYSSILSGTWDATTGAGGGNIEIQGIMPISGGVLVGGFHKVDDTKAVAGNDMPTKSVPTWGTNKPNAESIVLGRLGF